MSRKGDQDRIERRRPESERNGRGNRTNPRETRTEGKGRVHRRRQPARRSRRTAAARTGIHQSRHTTAARRIRTKGADRQRLFRRLGHQGSARSRRRHRGVSARHRRGRRDRSRRVEIQLAAQRLRRIGRRVGGGPHHRVRRAMLRRQLFVLRRSAELPQRRLSDRGDRSRRQLHDHQTSRAPAVSFRSAP